MKNNFFRKNQKSSSRYYRNVHCVKFWCRNVENSGVQVNGQKRRLFLWTTTESWVPHDNTTKKKTQQTVITLTRRNKRENNLSSVTTTLRVEIKKILAAARFPYKNKHLVRFKSVICTFKCQKIQIYGDNFLSGTEKARKVYHQ